MVCCEELRQRTQNTGNSNATPAVIEITPTRPAATTVHPQRDSSSSRRDDTASVGSSIGSLPPPQGTDSDSDSTAPVAAAASSTGNPLTTGAAAVPNVYRVDKEPQVPSNGCFAFNNTLVGSLGIPDEYAPAAFSVGTNGLKMASHPRPGIGGYVVVPLSPAVHRTAGDVYVDVKRNSLQPVQAVMLLLPSRLIAVGIERLWVGEVASHGTPLDIARRTFGLARETDWAAFCSDGVQANKRGEKQVAALQWWPEALANRKRTMIGCQLLGAEDVRGVTKHGKGDIFTMHTEAQASSSEDLSIVFVIPSGIELTVMTDGELLEELRSGNPQLRLGADAARVGSMSMSSSVGLFG